MGALTSVFGEVKNAFVAMRGNAYDENDLDEAIESLKKEDPTSVKYLDDFREIAELTEKDLAKKAEKMFDKSPRLEDKIGKEKAKVDVEVAKKSDKVIEKEDRQRIR